MQKDFWRPWNSKRSSIEAVGEAASDLSAALNHHLSPAVFHFFSSSQRAQSHFSSVNPLQLVGHVDICPETQRSGESSAGNRLGSARIHHASAGTSRMLQDRGCMAAARTARTARTASCLQPCIQIRLQLGRRRRRLRFGRLTDVSYVDL